MKLYTAKQVAKMLNIPLRSIYQYTYYGLIKSVAKGHLLFTEKEIERIKELRNSKGRGRKPANGVVEIQQETQEVEE